MISLQCTNRGHRPTRTLRLSGCGAGALVALLGVGCSGGGSTTDERAAYLEQAEECLTESGNICPVAGTGVAGVQSEEGLPALDTEMYLPQDVTMGPDDKLYIIDWNNHRIRALDDGSIETVVGAGELGDAPDGLALETKLNHPTHVAFEADGSMLVSAWHNSKVMRYDPDTEMMESICGTGARSFNGDDLPPLETFLDLPVATAVMEDGSILISDQANQRVRKLDPEGVMSTLVGTGEKGYTGDGGPAAEAQIYLPVSQSAPPAGRIALHGDVLYIADSLNHVIRKVEDGIITTIAGTGEPGDEEGDDALSTELDTPSDVAIDDDGNVYIADTLNSCIRRVKPDGAIGTVAGKCGESGFEGDFAAAKKSLLNRPYGIDVGPDGSLYIADTHNHVIRVIVP